MSRREAKNNANKAATTSPAATVHAPPMSVPHGVSHIDAIAGPSPPISNVIAATIGAAAAAIVAPPISFMPETADALTMLVIGVTPLAGVVDAATPRTAHIRLIAKAIPTHRGRAEALTSLGATDMDTTETVSET